MTKKENETGIVTTGVGSLSSPDKETDGASSLTNGKADLELAAGHAAIQVMTEAIRTGIQVYKLRDATKAQWEATEQWLAKHEAESADELQRLEGILSSQGGDTEQLRSLLDFYHALDPDKAPLIAESVGKAIEQITARQR